MKNFFNKLFKRKPSYAKLQKSIKNLQKYQPLFKPETPALCMDRPFIDNWVKICRKYVTGDVLEFFGSSMYGEKYIHDGGRIFTATRNANGKIKTDFTFDLEQDTINLNQRFDCIICTQVLNYTFNPQVALENLKKLLKPGGRLIITVPGTWGPHCPEAPFTYNFSLYGIKNLIKKVFGENSIKKYDCFGNFSAVINTALWVRYPSDVLDNPSDDFYTTVIGLLVENK